MTLSLLNRLRSLLWMRPKALKVRSRPDSWELWFLLILTVLAKFGQNPVDSVNFNRFSVPQKTMILAPAAQDFSLKIISDPKIFFFHFSTIPCMKFSQKSGLSGRSVSKLMEKKHFFQKNLPLRSVCYF